MFSDLAALAALLLPVIVTVGGCEDVKSRKFSEAEGAVRENLERPDTVKFSNLSLHSHAVCGVVIAENANGDTVRSVRFLYRDGFGAFLEGTDHREYDAEDFPDVYQLACGAQSKGADH